MIGDWLAKQAGEYILKSVTKDKIDKWATDAKAYVLPKVKAWKDDVIGKLRAEAAKTETTLDDMAVDKLDKLIEAFIPFETDLP